MLEVGKPATQDGIEVCDDSLQAVATGTPRLVADDVLQSRETSLLYGATTTLEAIAEELKPVTGLPTIPDMGLGGIYRVMARTGNPRAFATAAYGNSCAMMAAKNNKAVMIASPKPLRRRIADW